MKTTEEIAVGFYMWMQENGHDHNIKSRVEAKFKEYHQSELLKLNKSDVISSVCSCAVSSSKGKFKMCPNCLKELTGID